MTTTVQRVRELQEQIRANEAKLLELTQQPEYIAEQAFIQDVLDVLEIHSRTLKEAVLAIDPTLLGSAPKAPRKTYAPRKPKDDGRRSDAGLDAPSIMPAPKPSPFASFGQEVAPAPVTDHPLEPETKAAATKPAKPAKPAKRIKTSGNAKRNRERRVQMIQGGRWYLYTNPHTGETHEAAGQRDDILRGWAAEFGKGVVESWKRVITPAEAGL
jgi:hypothetical protein